ncbi:MAG: GGDEF domain-containing protein [Desulfoprunum sp.]|nr:GGDEF domain-containing protein [Desulfoprunum sp.]
MSNSLQTQVKEFCTAAAQPFSYNAIKNVYIWFGIFWGLPIPVVTISLHYLFLSTTGNDTPLASVFATPLQWFFLLHPLLFGTLFGILGSVRKEKDRQVARLIEELQILSIRDPLTGLSNRRDFAHAFADELARISRKEASLSLIFLDLDHFKRVNDSHGHHVGDEVLKATASHLHSCCRPYDTAARWGGEEFVILLPNTDELEAASFAERIRLSLQEGINPTILFPVTISIGVAQYRHGEPLEILVERADQALYVAKQNGRNQVVRWSSIALAA